MKNLILLVLFASLSFLTIAQSKFNFVGFGFTYCDITNQNIKIESLFKSGPISPALQSNGFNHYEIDLEAKTFIHRYAGENAGVKNLSRIKNISRSSEFVKFDVKTPEFGTLTCVINLNRNYPYSFIVKYKEGSKTEVAFFS